MEPRPGDEVIDAAGMALVPGLVNGHTHAAMTLFRGQGGDLPLMEWLEKVVWPVEARLDAEDVYWGTRLACVEMIRTGTVRFWDMYWHPGATARAVEDAGLRATIGAPLIDVGAAAGAETLREAAERSLEQIGAARELIAPALAPHAIYTVSESSLRWIAEAAEERRAARAHPPRPRPRTRWRVASRRTGPARPPTSTGSACWGRAPCSRTASGSTTPSSS